MNDNYKQLNFKKIYQIFIFISILVFLTSCNKKGTSISLKGEWEYTKGFQNEWLADPSITEWKKIEIPCTLDLHHDFKNYKGKVTLRKKLPKSIIKKLKKGEPIAFNSGMISDVSSLYFNSKLLKSFGSVKPYSSGNDRIFIDNIPNEEYIPDKSNAIYIVIPILDVFGKHGIKGPTIEIGESKYIYQKFYEKLMISSVLIMSYFLIGIFHLFLGIRRVKELYNIYFGIFCIFFSIFQLANTDVREIIFGANILLRFKIDQISLMVLVTSFVFFISYLFKNKHTITSIIIFIISTITIVIDLFSPIYIITYVLKFYYIIMLIALLYSTAIIAWEVFKKNINALSLFFGIIILAVSAIHDILVTEGYFNYPLISHYTFLIFFIGIAFILANRFVTVHNQMESLTVSLAYKIESRTKKLTKANEKLIEADKLKSNFFANISHEIRTPLTLILSPLESVLMGDYDKKIDKHFLNNMHRNAIKLLKLINNLLDFSKIEAGRMEMKVQEADIIRFVKNYISNVQETADSRKIKLDFESSNEHIENLYFDLEKIDKVIMNLFSNALKFTDSGGEIKIKIYEDKKYCHIEFGDTGIGIHPDNIESIFDRFSQGSYHTSKKYLGTGIGMSLVKELVEFHKGIISVESKWIDLYPNDHGSTFTISLAKGLEHFVDRKEVKIIKDNELDKSISGQRRFIGTREMEELKITDKKMLSQPKLYPQKRKFQNSVLIIDDNPEMRVFLSLLFDNHYDLFFAENGEDGLQKTKKLRPDIIVSDIMMPIMTGTEMTKKIKSDNNLKTIPIILLTAKADIEDKIEGIEFGADDYLTKPFNPKELLARVRSLLKTFEYQKIIAKRNSEIEEELETARLIQSKLLPENLPEYEGLQIHPTFIPMDKVGGDFYDYFYNKDTIDFFISDVSGHGIPGAFLASITKLALLNEISPESTPKNVMSKLNNVIFDYSVQGHFITSFYCSINLNSKKMKYCCAGHCPQYIYRKTIKKFIELQTKGPAMGWNKNSNLEEKEIQLLSNDRIFLYTDGITECMNNNYELFDEIQFKKFIEEHNNLTSEKFSEELIKHLKKFTSSNSFDDDLTLIVIDIK